ncbi:uncharacterized protein B0H18DRAFT_1038319 [Fomitopsis serialis]|uniref:uncharacterized protein n=1 Tax=Fomitopsis serialis TaxID=139415 RepID=UPI00200836E3|nr:uncharacterized protein B0H18DRAFT_1038319 [Neoantrodia serialis]KAH9916476.1 hypothetical protein B0H18DRAFT_1038319 [Neoantrodia serialis]
MSTDAQAQEIAFLQATYLNNYCQLSITALVVYEHIITISQETHLLHGRKFSGGVLLFLLNRYTLLLFGAENLIYVFSWDTRMVSCEAMTLLYDILQMMLYILTAGFTAMRVYAIGGQRALIAVIVFIFGLAPAIAGIYNISQSTYDYVAISDRVVIMSRVFPMVSDLIVIVVTCARAWPILRAARQARATPALVTLLLKDGTSNFVDIPLLASLNAIHIALSLSEGPFLGVVSEFITMFPSILISRFLMNLQHIGSAGYRDTLPSFVQRDATPEAQLTPGTSRFDITGDMGGSTDDGGLSALFSTTLIDVPGSDAWSSWDDEPSPEVAGESQRVDEEDSPPPRDPEVIAVSR